MRFHLPASVSPLGLTPRYTILFLALLAIPAVVQAGPNAGGRLILHAPASVAFTTDIDDYCGLSPLANCEEAVTRVDGSEIAVAYVYAAFGPPPRLSGLTFGVEYIDVEIDFAATGSCGDFELSDPSWPGSGSGTAVTWSSPQTTDLVEVYWFAAYAYYGNAVALALAPHPTHGGYFADDSVPSELDPIVGYGSLGFNQPGSLPCPDSPWGACCVGEECVQTSENDCLALGGIYFGDDSVCSPGLCFTVSCDGAPILVGDTGVEPDPDVRTRGPVAADVGRGHGVLGQTREETGGRDCGLLIFHADGSYENGYAWGYGGVAEPCFGAFAEGYDEAAGLVCSVTLDLTQVGYASGRVMDVYVWDDSGENPGAVLDARPGVDPGQVAFWPSISRHVVDMNLPAVGSRWWVGYWGEWPGDVAGWFVAADLDGPVRGRSQTLIAPGIGYPSGWQDVSVVWGPTQSLGLGAEILIEGLGACCRPDGTCYLATEATCGGEFLGEGTVCAPNPCPQPPLGACCFADGNCIVLPEFSCAAIDGVYQGDETVCEPNPCPQPPEGACCLEDGACFVLTAAQCAGLPGVYQGDDTLCEPNPCPQPTGACCFADGSCLVYTSQDCATAGGTYQGDHTLCQPNPCPQPTGACCFADGRCYVLTEEDCADVGAGYQGDHTVCEPNPCPQPPDGACCLFDGSCTVLTAALCSQGGGEYQGDDSTCDPNPCPQPVPGACCFAGGSCLVTLSYECQGGLFLGEGTTCEPNPCETPIFGACCLEGGRCEIRLVSGCDGEFQGAGTTCEPNPCPPAPMWACCQDTGVCQLRTQFDCGVEGGLFLEGYSCDPNPCPMPATGACCLADGTCVELEAGPCLVANGEYQGDDTACSPNPCVQPVIGACCLVLGACEVIEDSACAALDGDFLGEDSVCEPNPCPQPCEPFALGDRTSATRPTPPIDLFGLGRGAALRATGPNRGGTLVLHVLPDVVYTGDDAGLYCDQAVDVDECSDIVARTDLEQPVVVHAIALFPPSTSPRLMGVVFGIDYPDCVQILDWQACADFELTDGTWPAPGSGTAVTWSAPRTDHAVSVYWFAAQGIPEEPGELALGLHPIHGAFFADDHTPSRLDPILALGSAGFFRDGAAPCPSESALTGACCLPTGECAQATPEECLTAGGLYQGIEVPCDPDPCPPPPPVGACCSPESDACVLLDRASCTAGGGTYRGDGTDCSPNPCVAQVGACCLPNGGCQVATSDDCHAVQGLYMGTGTICDPSPCPPTGACCFDDGGCIVILEHSCDSFGGAFQGENVSCDGDRCPAPGACCFSDGSCTVMQELPCLAGGGSYLGDALACEPNPCPQPIGACCLAGRVCVILDALECREQGGSFLGSDVACEPNPCPEPTGACCLQPWLCEMRTAEECTTSGGLYLGDDTPCTARLCCDQPVSPTGTGVGSGTGPAAVAVGLGSARVTRADAGGCGEFVMNSDESYENAYSWQYAGIVPPYYGAFAEGYTVPGKACAVILDLTQIGHHTCQVADLYVWQDAAGVPGAVHGMARVEPGPIAFWPSISLHAFGIDSDAAVNIWVGYWAAWPGEFSAWYVGADLDGFGGLPYTNIAPGIGYPTGWNNVSVVWGPTQAIGIGMEFTDWSTPTIESSWGKVKALFR